MDKREKKKKTHQTSNQIFQRRIKVLINVGVTQSRTRLTQLSSSSSIHKQPKVMFLEIMLVVAGKKNKAGILKKKKKKSFIYI